MIAYPRRALVRGSTSSIAEEEPVARFAGLAVVAAGIVVDADG